MKSEKQLALLRGVHPGTLLESPSNSNGLAMWTLYRVKRVHPIDGTIVVQDIRCVRYPVVVAISHFFPAWLD